MKILEIAQPKATAQSKIYVDMDGVLVDLFNHVGEIHDVDHYNDMTQQQWDEFFKSTNAYELFRSLPAFATANALLKIVQQYAGGYTILSSPLNFDRAGSIRGKQEWLKNHITVPADAWVFEHDKYILIDDWGVNIDKWRAAGGIGIKFQSDEDTLNSLTNHLDQTYNLK
jgi:5' nucleotidase, deoxy (Pyrimidine), cytosolic type C protein (NT5C)